jgi:hypothetical protein
MNAICKSRFRQILGIIGGLVIAGGVAAPLIHIPIAGTITYLREPGYLHVSYHTGAIVILAAAAITLAASIAKYYRLLWLTGLAAAGQLAAIIIGFDRTVAAVEAKANAPDLVDPIVMWAGAALRQAHFEWGVAVIAVGALIIFLTAALPE